MRPRAVLVGCCRVLAVVLGMACFAPPVAGATQPSSPTCRTPAAPVLVATIPWASVRRSSGSAESWADPASFMVDGDGSVTILSPGLARLQSFRAGRLTASTSLPEEGWFEDFARSGERMTLLARAGAQGGVFELTAAGALRRVAPLPTAQIPQPSLITALEQLADGTWFIVDDAYAVSATAAAETVHPGTFWDDHGALRAVVEGGALRIEETPTAGGPPTVSARATIRDGRATVHIVTRLTDGRIAALVAVEHEQTAATRPPAVSAALLTWTAGVSTPCAAAIPWDARGVPPFEPLRRARAMADRVTFWRATRRGVELYSLSP